MPTTLNYGLDAQRKDTGSGMELPFVDLATRRGTALPEQGKKFDEGKLRYDLVPSLAFEEVVKAWTIGSKKYGDRNWENGLNYGRTFAALMRHAWAWWRGESYAKDDGQHHLAAVAWNALVLLHFELNPERYKKFDNRPND